ncbi:MAG: HlyD family secretion protein [Thermodesulfobacteriota bacterium]
MPKIADSLNGPWRRTLFLLLVILALGLGIYFGVRWLIFRWHYVSIDDAQVKGSLINLSAKVPGRIIRLLVEEGDSVQAGQVLVEIEKRDYTAAQAQASANLEIAKQELSKAITQLSLTKERVSQGIDTARASSQEAQVGVNFAEDDATLQVDRVNKEIEHAQASYRATLAKIAEARATMETARKEFARTETLFQEGLVPENSRDASETAWQVAKSKYEVALENEREALSELELAKANQRSITLKQQNIRVAEQVLEKGRINLNLAETEKKQILLQERNIELLKARVKEAEAAYQLTEIRSQETTMVSPIRGVISKRLAEEGQMVQPGQTILVVNDPGDKWIVANVEETKVRRVRKGARVNIEADAFPGKSFEAKVESVGAAAISEFALLPSDNPSGNFIKIAHRLPVRIFVKDPENLLKPGMMVVATIEASS